MVLTTLKRLLTLAFTLLAVSFLVFASLYLVPGDPLRFLMQGRDPSAEAVASITEQYGLDQPFFARYLTWLGNVMQGDFGRSFQFRDDVFTLILSRLPTTLGLVAYAAVVIVVIGLVSGMAKLSGRAEPSTA